MPSGGDGEKRLDRVRLFVRLTGRIDQFEHGAMANRYRRGFREDAAAVARHGPEQAGDVQEVQASVAKTHFSQLLDEVERGATIVILRHGRTIARIVPDPDGQQQRKKQAIENIRRLAKQIREETGGATVEEILSSIHEGHRI